ncbi:hypothetical protein CVU37_06350 [candidate division BRC1 bacterium HGW-BRC1-1]|jgi:hypothetical protein|nr:MAG: hypothetical protein CVU37_06350 [candidate division BRC1 bacterium HGW-BRC1-1]
MKRFSRNILLLAALAGGGSPAQCETAASHFVPDPARACALAERLLKYQDPEGRILLNLPSNPSVRLVPYFSNLAALGWTEAARVTTDISQRTRFLDATERWLRWYAANLNPDGTIYDFEGPPRALKSKNDYDSSDSYPATFAMVAWRHRTASGDTSLLRNLQPALTKAYGAILLTMDEDGLTYAKPLYPEKYLMDNLEVAAGLAAFTRCFTELGDATLVADATAHREQIQRSIPRYWRPSIGAFGYTIDPFGIVSGKLKVAYPDVLAQLMVLSWASNGDAPARQFLDRLQRDFFDNNPDARSAGQWWSWPAIVCADTELSTSALQAYVAAMQAPDPFAHDLGLAAATFATGTDAIYFDEVRMPWEALTSDTASTQPAASQPLTTFETKTARLILTAHEATAAIRDSPRPALLMPMRLPASIDMEFRKENAYVQANVVFAATANLSQLHRIGFDIDIPPTTSPGALQINVCLVDTDGDLWDARLDTITPERDGIRWINPEKTSLNKWGRNGDFQRSIAQTAGLRIQFNNITTKPASYQVTLKGIHYDTK